MPLPYGHHLVCLLLLLACADARTRDAEEGLKLSYVSYPDLAAAVRQRMDGAAAPPAPALGALSRELTAGRPDPHARALALTDWVRTHIRRLAPRLQFDGAAPRPAAAVLAQGSGNVEEIAVLLQALLAESGIASTAALVGRGGPDSLPDPAMPAAFEHMLVYIPALGLYLDPAADSIAAGYLPPALLGKPVLLASGGFAMTPMMQLQSFSIRATVDIRRDGSGTVTLERRYTGALTEPFRKVGHNVAQAHREQFLRRKPPGLSPPDSATLATFHPLLSTIDDAIAGMPGHGASGGDTACPAIDATDETRYRLPQATRILALPAPMSVIQGGVFYLAVYERQGNAVLVRRRLSFRDGDSTCTAAEVRAMRPALERIARDLHSEVTVAMP